jgi:hypothetical protein
VLVRGTYDERMLQQLVARQRWHSILLGRPGARLARDKKDVVNARCALTGRPAELSRGGSRLRASSVIPGTLLLNANLGLKLIFQQLTQEFAPDVGTRDLDNLSI